MKNKTAFVATLRAALREDVGGRDLTSGVIPSGASGRAEALFKEPGVLSGLIAAEQIFRLVDPDLRFLPTARDGDVTEPERVIFYAEGRCRSILAAERTALNFLMRMSGVATLTRKYVDRVKGTPAKIYDTRKTMPLLRDFDRYAVRCGGGHNHRSGLFDGVLIKNNHLRARPEENLTDVMRRIKARVSKKVLLGVEVRDAAEFEAALTGGFNYILTDHFTPAGVAEAVKLRNRRGASPLVEVSGDVTLENVRAYAEAGADRISIGRITHSAPAIDISLHLI